MDSLVSLPGMTVSLDSKVVVRFEINADINFTAFAARQRANRFLIMQVGDQLGAMQPELVVGITIHWRVPVQFAPSRLGPLGIVGHLLVDAQTGEVSISDGRTIEDLVANAETLYERATLPTGA